MSLAKRIIPKLDIKGKNLVKGVNLEGLRVLGKPEVFARHYYLEGADELIYQDVVASLYGFNSLEEIIRKTAKEIFIPLTVGGGIRNLDDIYKILRAGADKVSFNTAAIRNPKFIKEASRIFGSSTIAISIETILQTDGCYYAFTENGRNKSEKKLLNWIKEIEDLGAGEMIITFVDNEGSGKGTNLEITKKICNITNLPVIINGGFGQPSDVENLFKIAKVSGAAISSLFHYDLIEKTNLRSDKFEHGNIEFLFSNKKVPQIQATNIMVLKKYLKEKNIEINEII